MTSIRNLVGSWIEDRTPEDFADPDQTQSFVTDIYACLGANASPTVKRHLTRRLAALSRAWGISLPLPSYVRPLPKVQPARRADWPPRARRVLKAAAWLERSMPERHGSADDFADRALASAILRCGLLRTQTWQPFRRMISAGTSVHAVDGMAELLWFDLEIPRQKSRLAQTKDLETIRVFPDTETLGLMARAKGAAPLALGKPKELLARAMRAIGAQDVGVEIEDIEAAGFAALEDEVDHPIPAALFEVARGTLPAFTAPHKVWLAHVAGTPPDENVPATDDIEDIPRPARKRADERPVTLDAQISLARLCGSVMMLGAHAHKPTRAPVVAALQKLLADAPVPFVRGVVLWLLDLLARRRTVGTIRRYVAAVRSSCERMDMTDPASPSTRALEIRLEETLELASQKDRLYRAGRLTQLFDFAHGDPRLRWPKIMLGVEGDQTPCVRAALVGRKEIALALSVFADNPVAQVAVLLGTRGGLRLSDMEALQVKDVEAGTNGMVRIHHTMWKSLKTPSARRMVPLALLLTQDERKIWDTFLRSRMKAQPQDQFLEDGSPLKRLFDRGAFAAELGDKAGLRPHDLRHGALSNLALLLLSPEAASETVRHLTGWKKRQQGDLRHALTASDPWRGMKELTKIAGHFDPATTFESYIHICDLALGLHIQACARPFPRDEAARRIGTYSKTLGKGAIIKSANMRNAVLARIDVTVHKQGDVLAVVTNPLPVLDLKLIQKIDSAIVSGVDTIEIGQMFRLPVSVINAVAAFPRIGRLRSDKDYEAATLLAEQVLVMPEARQWANLTILGSDRGMVFRKPAQMTRWMQAFGPTMRFKAELRTEHPQRWDLGQRIHHHHGEQPETGGVPDAYPDRPEQRQGHGLCQMCRKDGDRSVGGEKCRAWFVMYVVRM